MRFERFLFEKIKWKHGYRVPTKGRKKKWKDDAQLEIDYWTKELEDLKKFKAKMKPGQPGGQAQASVGIGLLKEYIAKAKIRLEKQKAKAKK
jgi:hypothetical protein